MKRMSVALAIAPLAAGCASLHVEQANVLNRGLDYLPAVRCNQQDFLEFEVSRTSAAGNAQSLKVSRDCGSIRIRPGMVLHVVTLVATDMANNNIQTGISSFQWTMPGDPAVKLDDKSMLTGYSREDMLFVRFLSSAAFEDREGDPRQNDLPPSDCAKTSIPIRVASSPRLGFDRAIDEELCAIAERVEATGKDALAGSANFNTLAAQGVVGPILQSLTLSTPLPPTDPTSGTPGPLDLRSWFCEGKTPDYTSGATERWSNALRVMLPTLGPDGTAGEDKQVWRSYEVAGADDWHFAGIQNEGYSPELPKLDKNKRASEWFPLDSSNYLRRTSVSVGLPLSIEDGPPLPDAPVCASMETVEAALRKHAGEGAHAGSKALPRIVGFLRRDVFASDTSLGVEPGRERRAYTNSTQDNVGYVRFRFASAGDTELPNWVMIDDHKEGGPRKKDILVAPGDILILDKKLLSAPERLD